ncbi:uncharacterized protein PV09_00789 [Verruconis gallopava]|uniref:Uncharacterized protein n=1 Tax=Verruconis gallopava TaxID=253628 RepID=A0A0D2AQQ6_9PEZI|nr:uncharacterized protein PV09_00789 [Verruconis gallopava]KIW08865.1 hypothetical protein PV09_00789 [Verruconis gallopava]
MAPDLNSLPPSPNPAYIPPARSPRVMAQPEDRRTSLQAHSPSSHSLAAAAALNAGLHGDGSRRSSNSSLRDVRNERRRRSSIRMSLNLNDPTLPGPGELQQLSPRASRSGSSAFPESPHHHRTPSLGELHQEWESEQESQVNRLLNMIRQQQATIQNLQNQNAANQQNTSAVDDSTPTSERSMSFTHTGLVHTQPHPSATAPIPRSRSPFIPIPLSRNSSYRSDRSSHEVSPSLRPLPNHGPSVDSGEMLLGSSAVRDESAFYQAETQNLTRENQMLKLRIRELERQLSDLGLSPSNPHSPATTSNLHLPPITGEDAEPPQDTAAHS